MCVFRKTKLQDTRHKVDRVKKKTTKEERNITSPLYIFLFPVMAQILG